MTLSPALETLIDALPSVVVYVDDKLYFERRDKAHEAVTLSDIKASIDSRFPYEKDALPPTDATTPLTIHVPPTIASKLPLALVHIARDKDLDRHVHLELDRHAELTLIHLVHHEADRAVTMRLNVLAGDNAHLNILSVISSEGDGAHATRNRVHINQHARVVYTGGVFTHGPTHHDTEVTLAGPYAENDTNIIALTDHAQESLINTRVVHRAPRTRGQIDHAGVAADDSTLLFEGVGKIHKGMIKSQAFQHNRGVVLGDNARLDANPLLLIDEHDVEAGHGAAIGRIDENQLYYLMSRGMTKTDAEKLIIQGYLAPLKRAIDHDALHARLDTLLHDKIK